MNTRIADPLFQRVFAKARDAVIVAGHAVFTGNCEADAPLMSAWAGLFGSGYREGDEPGLYTEHVRAGVDIAGRNPDALLIFSGAPTNEVAGPISEALSYFRLAAAHDWWGATVRERAACEEFARDSFENCLFGILRFKQLTGNWPRLVTVVSFLFKKARFDFHMETLKSSGKVQFEDYQFHGPNNPPHYRMYGTEGDDPGALSGEASTFEEFRNSPTGTSEFLQRKRVQKDPFRRIIPIDSNPYCGVIG